MYPVEMSDWHCRRLFSTVLTFSVPIIWSWVLRGPIQSCSVSKNQTEEWWELPLFLRAERQLLNLFYSCHVKGGEFNTFLYGIFSLEAISFLLLLFPYEEKNKCANCNLYKAFLIHLQKRRHQTEIKSSCRCIHTITIYAHYIPLYCVLAISEYGIKDLFSLLKLFPR